MNPTSGNLQISRVPATLRLGSGSGTKRKLNTSKPASNRPTQVKTLKKRAPASIKGTIRTRGKRSPLQGTKFTRQMTTRAASAARKRLCVDRKKEIKEVAKKITGLCGMSVSAHSLLKDVVFMVCAVTGMSNVAATFSHHTLVIS
ncbi:hypothetical protein YC2023_012144 [Brassica napus]